MEDNTQVDRSEALELENIEISAMVFTKQQGTHNFSKLTLPLLKNDNKFHNQQVGD